jgi:transposase
MSDATCAGGFVPPDLTSFCRLDGLGLVVTGQRISAGRAVLACRVVGGGADGWCGECGCKAVVRDSVVRRLAHEPFGWRPTTLVVSLRRYRCDSCGRVWRQDMIAAAEPRATLSRRALAWALEALVVGHLSVARIAEALDVSWNTANDAVLAEGRRVLISDPGRFEGVRVLGVDEHVWRHTRAGDKYVTVIIDLTPVRDGTGPARLLDMVAGRTAGVFADWLAARPEAWRKRIEVVAMDGFTGYKTATATELPEATAVMDPFHVIRLAGDALDGGRRRVQQALHGHRGRRGDPLYTARRTLHTGADLLTDRQRGRLDDLFAADDHTEVEVTWAVYQRMVAAYCHPNRVQGRQLMAAVTASLQAVPAGLAELATLGRTLKKRSADVLAYFDRPGTSNGPTEAINGRLEHLRGTALGFRNLTNYIARSLLEAGGFRPRLHPRL